MFLHFEILNFLAINETFSQVGTAVSAAHFNFSGTLSKFLKAR